MISKKGQGGESPSLLMGLLIMVLLLVAVGLASYLIAEKNVDVRARVAFDDFLGYYQNCTEQEDIDCRCDDFDLGLLSDDFQIRVVDLEHEKIGFELYEGDEKVVTASTAALPLCAYYYSSELEDYTTKPLPGLVVRRSYVDVTISVLGGSPEFSSRAQQIILHRGDGNMCFVYDPNPPKLLDEPDELLKRVHEDVPLCGSNTPQPATSSDITQPLFP